MILRHPTGGREDKFLGALLGLAIGDALGMPVAGMSRAAIADRFGRIETFLPGSAPGGGEIKAGEFTDESEVVLCIVESLTTNEGTLDVENIGARLLHLLRGDSAHWMSGATRVALELAERTSSFRVQIDEDGPATGDVAVRGVPIGLLLSVGALREDRLVAMCEEVTRMTHGSPAAISATSAVAFAVQLAARGDEPPERWAGLTAEFLGSGELADRLSALDRRVGEGVVWPLRADEFGTDIAARECVPTSIAAAAKAPRFEDAVLNVVNAGGATDTNAALAGALAGARFGASGIPQRLIDGLGGRIYVSLAAPWFYRTALFAAGNN